MFLSGGFGIIIKVVDNESVAIGWEVDIKFDEERDDVAWSWSVRG